MILKKETPVNSIIFKNQDEPTLYSIDLNTTYEEFYTIGTISPDQSFDLEMLVGNEMTLKQKVKIGDRILNHYEWSSEFFRLEIGIYSENDLENQ